MDDSAPELLRAIFLGEHDVVRRFCMDRKDIECVDTSTQRTGMHLVAQSGDVLSFDLLKTAGATIDVFDKSGWHPLHHAANTGSNGIVLRLIDSNIDVNVRTKNMTSASPLHFAVSEGRLMTARILLLNGADPSLPDKQHKTPLYKAVRWGKFEMAELLMCFGAEPEENLTGALELSPADRDLKSRFEELLSSGAPASSVRTYQQPIDVQDVLHASEVEFNSLIQRRKVSRRPTVLGEGGIPLADQDGTRQRRESVAQSPPMQRMSSPLTNQIATSNRLSSKNSPLAAPLVPPSGSIEMNSLPRETPSKDSDESSSKACCIIL